MLDRAVYVGLALLLVFTTLAFGATEIWSMTIMQLGVGLLFGVYVIGKIRQGRLEIANPDLILLFVLLALLALLQVIPWPSHNNARVMQLITGAPAPSPLPSTTTTLSVYPYATKQALQLLLCYMTIFILASCLFAQPARTGPRRIVPEPDWLIHLIIFISFLISALSVLQCLVPSPILFLFSDEAMLFGPFVNRNHFAGYMELSIPLVLAIMFLSDLKLELMVLYGTIAAIMTFSVFLSLSRSGIVTLFVQLFFMACLLRRSQKTNILGLKGYFMTFAFFLLAGAFFWSNWEQVIYRFFSIADYVATPVPGRMAVWKDTAAICRDFFWTGSGLGTFVYVYPLYQSVAGKWEAAHNDYLQLLCEMGMLGFGLAALFIGVAVRRSLSLIQSESSRNRLAIRVGSLTSCLGILLHSFTDFNLQVPSNAFLFCVLLGIATAHIAPNAAKHSPATRPMSERLSEAVV
ncbi:MAG: O-antigen ligase family protein [Acidobacteria bacterium]|nr:O-antigen ligase family protein [Acidobacteriota bacterium]MBI3657369.1 O-antigen ligase family protein [Acidobacteriota bacterium]